MDYLKTKGRIFDIQRYSIHDGPGIRTIVFLKGCIFRCRWCCNPESQNYGIEHMKVEGKDKVVGRDVIVEDVINRVMRDSAYYRRSGGGITLSGGECLCQPEFSRDLLRAAKDRGISTAIETTGGLPFTNIAILLPFLDTCLLDIKHINSAKHKKFTGCSNETVLRNAVKVAESAMTHLIIRVPVVPLFNASREELLDIAGFADTLLGVRKIHLLPYHRLGQDKYKSLGRDYSMADILPPERDFLEEMKKEIEKQTKLHCQIGG